MRNADLICKLCGSNKLTKYGRHPGGQRYLCDNCGHTFTDNKSLPGMRVNKAIIDRFVELRSQSKTFSQIIDIVQAEFGINLSKGTLWKWQRKFFADADN